MIDHYNAAMQALKLHDSIANATSYTEREAHALNALTKAQVHATLYLAGCVAVAGDVMGQATNGGRI